jgi:hypothetical protein
MLVLGVGLNCTVASVHETKYEMDSIQFSCFTNFSFAVIWGVDNAWQRKLKLTKVFGPLEYRPIYNGFILLSDFRNSGRYHISLGNGFYNLTISKLHVSETGEYICHEKLANGPAHFTHLSVLGKITTFHKPPCSFLHSYQTMPMKIQSSTQRGGGANELQLSSVVLTTKLIRQKVVPTYACSKGTFQIRLQSLAGDG